MSCKTFFFPNLRPSKIKPMKFTEEKLEKSFIELLRNENFPHHFGNTITRAADDVLIEQDLIVFCMVSMQKYVYDY